MGCLCPSWVKTRSRLSRPYVRLHQLRTSRTDAVAPPRAPSDFKYCRGLRVRSYINWLRPGGPDFFLSLAKPPSHGQIGRAKDEPGHRHSASFDHLRRPEAFRSDGDGLLLLHQHDQTLPACNAPCREDSAPERPKSFRFALGFPCTGFTKTRLLLQSKAVRG